MSINLGFQSTAVCKGKRSRAGQRVRQEIHRQTVHSDTHSSICVVKYRVMSDVCLSLTKACSGDRVSMRPRGQNYE